MAGTGVKSGVVEFAGIYNVELAPDDDIESDGFEKYSSNVHVLKSDDVWGSECAGVVCARGRLALEFCRGGHKLLATSLEDCRKAGGNRE